jgi:Fic family protein
VRIPWREVEPLPKINGAVEPVLATVDALRSAWEEALGRTSPDEFAEARQRSLRRHAIETGIIERLYDLDWGVTEALVAEGITAEVAAREGGVSDDALRLIRDQLHALEYLTEAVREGRELSVFFVRELHQLITRHQPTYEARDALGNLVHVPLPHGDWKSQPNHVRRLDGSLLEYTPPEHVPAQMEQLVEQYAQTASAHPIVRAAWLHHRFICIHPFADGNGRVARALTLLALLQARYAPLVVDRRNRGDYVRAIDDANGGDLRPLIRLFGQLETVALRTELERPAVIRPASGTAVDIARAYADRLQKLRRTAPTENIKRAEVLARELQRRVERHLRSAGDELTDAFRPVDSNARADVNTVGEPGEEANVLLRLAVLDRRLFYGIQLMEVGDTGVLSFRLRGWVRPRKRPSRAIRVLNPSPTDTVTIVPTDDVNTRWPEVEELIDRTLAAAVDGFGQLLGKSGDVEEAEDGGRRDDDPADRRGEGG